MCISGGGGVGEGVNEGKRSGKFRMWWSVEFWDHLGERKTANLVGLN